ncbi:hypoxanthine phosphoribosyltransferase [Rhodohalobacter halophilus]|uniref:hypoxanthine phosphoribosyltransferase n=1 Tax=Rhodohalobacter halophilus TaxID=1812810 RepID=UPI00083F82CA|nr:hypoxanthine phosphoribosyltransferase [Rhodohalobacter halophilus]
MGQYLPEKINVKGESFRIYLTQEEIQQRIKQIGKQLSTKFQDKRPIFIGVLNGSYIFLADLMRYVNIPCEVDFMKLSSYGDEKVSSGQVHDLKQIDADIQDRHVIIVEDIVDTGLSMKYLVEKLKQHQPASLTVVTLLHKAESTQHDVQIDFTAFKIPNLFVLGYGLDFAQEGRNLGQIYIQTAGEDS